MLNPGHIKGTRFFGRAISEISGRKGSQAQDLAPQTINFILCSWRGLVERVQYA